MSIFHTEISRITLYYVNDILNNYGSPYINITIDKYRNNANNK